MEKTKTVAHPRPPRKLPEVLNIAHRGAAADAPENTLLAFEMALEQEADAIEFDVRLSSDGVPMVIHSARLGRTTSGNGLVSDRTAVALQRLDAGSWFNRRFPRKARRQFVGLRIPTLGEVLAWVAERQCAAFLEIKEGGPSATGVERAVIEEIRRAGVAQLTRVISFDHAALRRLRKWDSCIAIGASFRRPLLAIRLAKSLGAGSVAPHWAFVTRGFIRRAHEEGLEVFTWTLNQPSRMRRQIIEGVDGIITDRPAWLAAVRATISRARGLGANLTADSRNYPARATYLE